MFNPRGGRRKGMVCFVHADERKGWQLKKEDDFIHHPLSVFPVTLCGLPVWQDGLPHGFLVACGSTWK